MFRRSLLKYGLGSVVASPFITERMLISYANAFEKEFDGFDGQTIVWGGISYLPSNPNAALPNFFPLFDKKASGGVPIIDNALTKALEKVSPSVWEEKGFRLSIAEGGLGGNARFGMIMSVASELIIQDSRSARGSYSVYRLIAYNFIFSINKKRGTRILASYPVGGRFYSYMPDEDQTPIEDYFLSMFTTEAKDGLTIPNWYTDKLKEYSFQDVKLGLNYRVDEVILGEGAKSGLDLIGVAHNIFSDWVGFATTMSFGQELKVSVIPYKDSATNTKDLALNFRNKEPFSLTLEEGDVALIPTVHQWTTEYKDHPRDDEQYVQRIIIYVQLMILYPFEDGDDKWRFNQVIIAEEVQAVFKDEEYRRSDETTIYLLIEKLLDTTFAAIRQEGKRKQLLEGYKEVYETTERNKEITPYISIEVHNQTAANFEKECEAVLEI